MKIERLIFEKAYRIRTRLTFFLFDLYNFSNIYHKKVKDFNYNYGTFFNTDSKQAYLAAIAAPTFQEGGDDGVLGVWPVSFSGSRFAEQG